MGKTYSQLTNNHWLILIIGISFFASVFYSFAYRIEPAVDARAYDEIARNIAAGRGFAEDASVPIEFDRSIQRAGPAYEYMLAGLYLVFGHHYEAVWIIQAVLHAVSAWLLFLVAAMIFQNDTGRGERIGLAAAALFGLHPDLIEISAMLMTETLYLFFIVMILFAFVHAYKRPESWLWAAVLGLLLGLGILSRPPVLLFVPIMAVLYIMRRRMLQLALMIGMVSLVMAPWVVRNYQIYDQFILTTVIGEYNIWIGNTPASDGGQLGGGYNPFDAYVAEHGYLTVRDAATDAFQSFLREHPVRFIELTAIRFVRFFSLIRPMGFWFYQTGVPQMIFLATSGIGIAVLFSLGLVGMVVSFRDRGIYKRLESLYWYLIALAAVSPLVLLPTVVQSRYRFQMYPFFALFGGYALLLLMQDPRKAWKRPGVIAPLVFLLIVTLIDIALFKDVIADRLRDYL